MRLGSRAHAVDGDGLLASNKRYYPPVATSKFQEGDTPSEGDSAGQRLRRRPRAERTAPSSATTRPPSTAAISSASTSGASMSVKTRLMSTVWVLNTTNSTRTTVTKRSRARPSVRPIVLPVWRCDFACGAGGCEDGGDVTGPDVVLGGVLGRSLPGKPSVGSVPGAPCWRGSGEVTLPSVSPPDVVRRSARRQCPSGSVSAGG